MVNPFRKLSFGGLHANKLVLVGATIASTAVIGSAGIAAAHASNNNGGDDPSSNPGIVHFCKEHYQDLGFKNLGQCVSSFQHNRGHGYGYGGKCDSDNDGDNDCNHHHHHHHHHHWWGWND